VPIIHAPSYAHSFADFMDEFCPSVHSLLGTSSAFPNLVCCASHDVSGLGGRAKSDSHSRSPVDESLQHVE
jgi:hypothetical protein